MFIFEVQIQLKNKKFLPSKSQFHKMVKHTQTIRRQIECVWLFCGIGA